MSKLKKQEFYPHEWKGNNSILCNGSIVTGSGWVTTVGTFILIQAASTLATVFPASYLTSRTSISFVWICIIFQVTITILLCYSAFTDPGIIPRQKKVRDPKFLKKRTSFRLKYYRMVEMNGVLQRMKYCPTCNIFRPPRTSHCVVCDNCIEVFDHHCPWIGNCVGKRNYKYFFAFLLSTTTYSVLSLVMSLTHILLVAEELQEDDEDLSGAAAFFDAVAEEPVSAVLTVLTFLSSIFVGILTTFHIYLVATGQTTNEKLKGTFETPSGNPFSAMGCFRNCLALWLRPKHPALLKIRTSLSSKSVISEEENENLTHPSEQSMIVHTEHAPRIRRRQITFEQGLDLESNKESEDSILVMEKFQSIGMERFGEDLSLKQCKLQDSYRVEGESIDEDASPHLLDKREVDVEEEDDEVSTTTTKVRSFKSEQYEGLFEFKTVNRFASPLHVRTSMGGGGRKLSLKRGSHKKKRSKATDRLSQSMTGVSIDSPSVEHVSRLPPLKTPSRSLSAADNVWRATSAVAGGTITGAAGSSTMSMSHDTHFLPLKVIDESNQEIRELREFKVDDQHNSSFGSYADPHNRSTHAPRRSETATPVHSGSLFHSNVRHRSSDFELFRRVNTSRKKNRYFLTGEFKASS